MRQNIIFVLSCLLQVAYTVSISCPDQSPSCECPADAAECEFYFRVSERFSFASYALDNDQQLTVGGSLYFLNDTGYHATSQSNNPCKLTTSLVSDEDFTSNNCSIPMTLDGVNYRSLILINGRIPGPTLVVHEGQIIIVHVFNQLLDVGITIHWHGLSQLGSPWMDGVGFVTQPPIDAGASFDYIFKAEPSGTHWYHSHIGSQKSDGLFGGLVILEQQSFGDILGNSIYDNVINNPGQHTLTLIDWQRKEEDVEQALADLPFFPQLPLGELPSSDQEIAMSSLNSPDGSGLGLIPFWSGLINGKGRKTNSTLTPLSIFKVDQGETYHFRLVGSISIYALRVSIDDHKLLAIASDGRYFDPVEVDYIIIHTGETYDFLLNATQGESEYWIRAETLEVLPSGTEHSARAILMYGNVNDLDWTTGYSNVPERERPCSSESPCNVLNCPFENYPTEYNLNCISLTSLVGRTGTPESEIPRYPPDPNCTDCEHFLNFAFQGEDFDSSVNSKSFELPPLAYSTNCYEYEEEMNDNVTNTCNKCVINQNSTTGGCSCIDVVEVANQETYDPATEPQSIALVFSSRSAFFAHPIHLHGHSYHVVYIGYGVYNSEGQITDNSPDLECESGLCANPGWSNDSIPQGVLNRTVNGRVVSTAIRKDTIIIPPGGYVVVAFQADNPGYWIMHCHIEEHLLNGMAVVLQEYSPGQQWVPPEGINLHGSFEWTIDEYHETLNRSEFCNSTNVPSIPTAPLNTNNPSVSVVGFGNPGEISVLVVGFGFAMAVIAILSIAVLIMTVVIILSCLKKKNVNQESTGIGLNPVSEETKKVPISETRT